MGIYMLSTMIIGIAGAIVGMVRRVRPHPRGIFIWLADVDFGDASPVQIVYGGDRKLTAGELVPVAPPGSRALHHAPRIGNRWKKMRARRYRGERSHGMLCSLDELGWIRGGPNEVAVLRALTLGDSLDELPEHLRPKVVVGWERAKLMEKQTRLTERMVRTALTDMFDPAAEAVCS
jgi:tRNA-binding EMAP/Myf-like protein